MTSSAKRPRAGFSIKSTPATLRLDRSRGIKGERFRVSVESKRLRATADGDVRSPIAFARMASNRPQNAAVQDERANVVAGVSNVLLEINDKFVIFKRVKDPSRRLAIVEATESASFRAEQRLDDDVAAEPVEGVERGARIRPPKSRARERRRVPNCASARYLLTLASIAFGELTTGVPPFAKRSKASMRKTTCSKLPGGIIRTKTASARARSIFPADTFDPPKPTQPLIVGNATGSKSISNRARRGPSLEHGGRTRKPRRRFESLTFTHGSDSPVLDATAYHANDETRAW